MQLTFLRESNNLTDAEQKIINYIEENREEFLFMSIGQLARKLEVSEATILRFSKHIGCDDFKDLKNIIMKQNHLEGPVGKLAGTLFVGSDFSMLNYLRRQQLYIEKTIECMMEEDFVKAVNTIVSSKKVFIHAKSASASIGQLLFFRLRRLGIEVVMLPSSGTEVAEGLVQAKSDDLVIFFGFSKLSYEGKMILERAATAKYKTLMFTSRLYLPKEENPDINLYVYRGDIKEYHSMTTAVAIIDAIVVAVSEKLGCNGVEYLQEIHNMKKKMRKSI